MEVFRELVVRGSESLIEALVTAVTDALPEGWIRDVDAERRLASFGGTFAGSKGFAFSRLSNETGPSAGMLLLYEDGELKVANIVPHEKSELSIAEYNAVLGEFERFALRPAAERLGLPLETTAPVADATAWMSPAAAELLRSFSVLANKSTGAAHPLDRRRWHKFMIAAHREGARLDGWTLRRLLSEELGWSSDRAGDLAEEYELARELLRDYDAS